MKTKFWMGGFMIELKMPSHNRGEITTAFKNALRQFLGSWLRTRPSVQATFIEMDGRETEVDTNTPPR